MKNSILITLIEVVNTFNYLGLHFNYNCKYTVSTIFLFDTYISSMLNYASEVWGVDKGVNIEKLHLDFCKRLLGVKKSTCNIMVYCELGRLPLNATRKIRVINYWSKLLSTDNCILKQCYKQLLQDISICKNWLCDVKDSLYSLGFNYVWRLQKIDKCILQTVKQRICDQEKQLIFSKLQEMTKCRIYKHLIFFSNNILFQENGLDSRLTSL